MKKAFTLAEVLITLAVIGVVAALTLPNVLANFRERTYIASLQKAYNQMSNAIAQYMAVENLDNLAQSDLRDSSGRDKFLYKYFKVQKDCGSSMNGCFSNSYYDVNRYTTYSFNYPGDQNGWLMGGDYKCVVIDTGAGICLSTAQYDGTVKVTLDTNGSANPNINGRDFFQFFISADGRVGSTNNTGDYVGVGYSYCSGISYGCLSKIISDGWTMKY